MAHSLKSVRYYRCAGDTFVQGAACVSGVCALQCEK